MSDTYSGSWPCEELNINRHAAVSCISAEIPQVISKVTLVLLYVMWTYTCRFYTTLWLLCFKPFVISVLCISSHWQSIRAGWCSKNVQGKPCSQKTILRLCKQIPQLLGLKNKAPLWRFQCIYVYALYYNVHVYKDFVNDLSHYLHLCTCTLNA